MPLWRNTFAKMRRYERFLTTEPFWAMSGCHSKHHHVEWLLNTSDHYEQLGSALLMLKIKVPTKEVSNRNLITCAQVWSPFLMLLTFFVPSCSLFWWTPLAFSEGAKYQARLRRRALAQCGNTKGKERNSLDLRRLLPAARPKVAKRVRHEKLEYADIYKRLLGEG